MNLKQLHSRWVYGVLVVLAFLGYVGTNHTREVLHSTVTSLDANIPFLSFFAIPYLVYLPLLVGTIIFALYKFGYREKVYLQSVIVSECIAVLCFVIFPTVMTRQSVMDSGFFDNLVKYVYSVDNPFNAFPSTHVLHAVLCGIYLHKKFLPVVVNLLLIGSICLSTVFIKQHYILDVFGGLVLASVVYFFMKKLNVYDK
jgi:membrane-associated phospholipid phosphatase